MGKHVDAKILFASLLIMGGRARPSGDISFFLRFPRHHRPPFPIPKFSPVPPAPAPHLTPFVCQTPSGLSATSLPRGQTLSPAGGWDTGRVVSPLGAPAGGGEWAGTRAGGGAAGKSATPPSPATPFLSTAGGENLVIAGVAQEAGTGGGGKEGGEDPAGAVTGSVSSEGGTKKRATPDKSP